MKPGVAPGKTAVSVADKISVASKELLRSKVPGTLHHSLQEAMGPLKSWRYDGRHITNFDSALPDEMRANRGGLDLAKYLIAEDDGWGGFENAERLTRITSPQRLHLCGIAAAVE